MELQEKLPNLQTLILLHLYVGVWKFDSIFPKLHFLGNCSKLAQLDPGTHKMTNKNVPNFGPVSDRLLDHRRSNLVQARTKFNRLLAMVDDLNNDQKQAHHRLSKR